MFISRKRWNQMERRVVALEKICRPDVSPLSRMKVALEAAWQSHARLSQECLPIVIPQSSIEEFASLIQKGNSSLQ